ncbi:Protein of unknown function (DUF1044) [Pseudidiomarina woesei]|uniref:RelE toxin of RelE / RelB toxin-antitoxin system n=2 Tax=Pseudidiomarina woesei TaxID=1381080 RepID=A0A0K6GWV9_9GAMM|nr:Protein of unknown function (DUF1044) [Pseudidiomarina woesei]
MTFVETSLFTRQMNECSTDDELRMLQIELIANPEKGAVIPGAGGLRKVRMGIGNSGKSGGARVINYFAQPEYIYLLFVYLKSKKINLSAKEKSILTTLVAQLKGDMK